MRGWDVPLDGREWDGESERRSCNSDGSESFARRKSHRLMSGLTLPAIGSAPVPLKATVPSPITHSDTSEQRPVLPDRREQIRPSRRSEQRPDRGSGGQLDQPSAAAEGSLPDTSGRRVCRSTNFWYL